MGWTPATAEGVKPAVTVRIDGDGVQKVWLEYAGTRLTDSGWNRLGRPIWKAPYILSVDQRKLPSGRVQLRVAAQSTWEDVAYSTPFRVDVSTASAAQ